MVVVRAEEESTSTDEADASPEEKVYDEKWATMPETKEEAWENPYLKDKARKQLVQKYLDLGTIQIFGYAFADDPRTVAQPLTTTSRAVDVARQRRGVRHHRSRRVPQRSRAFDGLYDEVRLR